MPFNSIRQAQVCYGKRLSAQAQGKRWTWDCDEALRKTTNCIPTSTTTETTTRHHKLCGPFRPSSQRIYYEGARGGIYFYADQDHKLKIYVPKNAKEYVRRHVKRVYK